MSNNSPGLKVQFRAKAIMGYKSFFNGYLDYCLGEPFDYDKTTISYERGRQFAILYGKETPAYNFDGQPLDEAVKFFKDYMKEGLLI